MENNEQNKIINYVETLLNEFYLAQTSNQRKQHIELELSKIKQHPTILKICIDTLSISTNKYMLTFMVNIMEEIVIFNWESFTNSYHDVKEVYIIIWALIQREKSSLPEFIKNKLIRIFCDIGRMIWPDKDPNFLNFIINLIKENITQSNIGLKTLNCFIEEIYKYNKYLPRDREIFVQNSFKSYIPNIVDLIGEVLENNHGMRNKIRSSSHNYDSSMSADNSTLAFDNTFDLMSPLSNPFSMNKVMSNNNSPNLSPIPHQANPFLSVSINAGGVDVDQNSSLSSIQGAFNKKYNQIKYALTIYESLLENIVNFSQITDKIFAGMRKCATLDTSSCYSSLNSIPSINNLNKLGENKIVADRNKGAIISLSCFNYLISKPGGGGGQHLLNILSQLHTVISEVIQQMIANKTGANVSKESSTADSVYVEKFLDLSANYLNVIIPRLKQLPNFPISETIINYLKLTLLPLSTHLTVEINKMLINFTQILINNVICNDVTSSLVELLKPVFVEAFPVFIQLYLYRHNGKSLIGIEDEDDEAFKDIIESFFNFCSNMLELYPADIMAILTQIRDENSLMFNQLIEMIRNSPNCQLGLNQNQREEVSWIFNDLSTYFSVVACYAGVISKQNSLSNDSFSSGIQLVEEHCMFIGSIGDEKLIATCENENLTKEYQNLLKNISFSFERYISWVVGVSRELQSLQRNDPQNCHIQPYTNISAWLDQLFNHLNKNLINVIIVTNNTKSSGIILSNLYLYIARNVDRRYFIKNNDFLNLCQIISTGTLKVTNKTVERNLISVCFCVFTLPYHLEPESKQEWSTRVNNITPLLAYYDSKIKSIFQRIQLEQPGKIMQVLPQDMNFIKFYVKLVTNLFELVSTQPNKCKAIVVDIFSQLIQILFDMSPSFALINKDIFMGIVDFYLVITKSFKNEAKYEGVEKLIETLLAVITNEQWNTLYNKEFKDQILYKYLILLNYSIADNNSLSQNLAPKVASLVTTFIRPRFITDNSNPTLLFEFAKLNCTILLTHYTKLASNKSDCLVQIKKNLLNLLQLNDFDVIKLIARTLISLNYTFRFFSKTTNINDDYIEQISTIFNNILLDDSFSAIHNEIMDTLFNLIKNQMFYYFSKSLPTIINDSTKLSQQHKDLLIRSSIHSAQVTNEHDFYQTVTALIHDYHLYSR